MKNLLCLLLLLISCSVTARPYFEFSIEGQKIIIKNTSGRSQNLELRSGKKTIKAELVSHGSQLVYNLNKPISRSALRNLSVEATYTRDAFDNDLSILRSIKLSRERQRRQDAIIMGLLAAADDYFFNGFFTKAVAVAKIVGIATDPRLSDVDKLERMFKEAGAFVKQTDFDDRRTQAAATGLITFVETYFDEDEDARDQDLVHLAMVCSQKYSENKKVTYSNLAQVFNFKPRYNFDLVVGYGAIYDVVDYNFIEYDRHNAVPLNYFGDFNNAPRPLYLGWNNRWLKTLDGRDKYAFVELNFGYESSPLLYFDQGNVDFTSGLGIQQRSLTAQLAYTRRFGASAKSGLDIGPSIGGGISQIRPVNFEDDSRGINNLRFGDYQDGDFIFTLGLNARLTLNRLNFFARYNYNVNLSETPDGKADTSAAFKSHTLHAGVGVSLFRAWRL